MTNPTADRAKGRIILAQIEAETNLELYNPFYDRAGNPTPEVRQLDRGERSNLSAPEIVSKDLKMIVDVDGVIAWVTNKTSWGSIQECVIAYREMHKAVYIIWDEGTRGVCEVCRGFNPNTPGHPWAEEHCTRSFGTLQGFIDFAKKEWGQPHVETGKEG